MPAGAGTYIALLVGITAVWGWTFVVVRDAVAAYPVLPFLFLRFILAAMLLLPALRGGIRDVCHGIVPGMFLSAGYLCQTLGLQHTTASKAGLLTGLMVVLTPLFVWCFHGIRPPALTLGAAGIAFAGTALLTVGGAGTSVQSRELLGDGLEVLTAALFACHIVLLGRLSPGLDALKIAFAQMVVAACAFGLASLPTGGVSMPSVSVLWAVVITGSLASALAFWVQTLAQQRISAARTAMILVMEPAFATLFGVLLAGDTFTVFQAVGAVAIVAALLLHESWGSRGQLMGRRLAGS